MVQGVLQAIGVDPDLPAAEKAAAMIRRLVLRWDAVTGPRQLGTVVEARWFAGTGECLKVLAELCRGTAARGTAFGSPWPYLDFGGRILAPALPIVAVDGEATGPDGIYALKDGDVWREAVGSRQLFIGARSSASPTDRPFDLLWFGTGERYLLRDQTLEVDDLFSSLRVAATPDLVDRLVLRGMRAEGELLDGIRLSDRSGPAEIEVRQPLELVVSDAWRDPIHVIRSRQDIHRADRRADEIHGQTILGDGVVFKLVEEPSGWRVFRWEGDFPLRTLALFERDVHLSYSATLSSGLDPFAPGARGRIVFDLRSELVALQNS